MQPTGDINQLRARAQWYRDFADVGSADNKDLRLSLARHFDRMADEAEERRRQQGLSEAPTPPTPPPAP